MKYEIVDVDLWECDAYLVVDGLKHYFQFTGEPTLEKALVFLFMQGDIDINTPSDRWTKQHRRGGNR